MKLNRLAFTACLAAAAPLGHAQTTNLCVDAAKESSAKLAEETHTTAEKIDLAKEVFARVASVAKLQPVFKICDSKTINAHAYADRDGQVVSLNSAVLEKGGADADVLSRILGHEVSHLILEHSTKKRIVVLFALRAAIEAAMTSYRKDSDIVAAREVLRRQFIQRAASASRSFEGEADELGFALAITAGYAVTDVGHKLRTLSETAGFDAKSEFWSTHPGFLERESISEFLETNENHRRTASRLYASKAYDRLGDLTFKWAGEQPESGAAFYYRSLWAKALGKPAPLVTEALEDSLQQYEQPKKGGLAQLYQNEHEKAALSLCLALVDEGRPDTALACVAKLEDADQVEFMRVTRWTSPVIVSKREPGDHFSSVWTAVTPEGSMYMTNLPRYYNEEYLRPSSPGRLSRPPRSTYAERARQANAVPLPAEARRKFASLHEAARWGRPVDVYALIQAGADAEALEQGLTPLGAAVLAGNADTVAYLLDIKVNPSRRDAFHRTAEEYALQSGHLALLPVLRAPRS